MKRILLGTLIILGVLSALVAGAYYLRPENVQGASVIQVYQGGTGATSFTAGECLKGNGTGAITTGSCGTGTGGGSNWSYATNYSVPVITPSSTITVWIKDALYASSTLTVGGTVNLNKQTYTFPSSQSANTYLKTDGSGALSWASAGGSTAQLGQIGDVTTSTPMTYGMVLRYNTSNSKWESVATSTLGIGGSTYTTFGTDFYTYFSATTTDYLTQGATNKYWSNTLFDNRLSASSSINGITTLNNLTTAGAPTSNWFINPTGNISTSGTIYANGGITTSGNLTVNGTGGAVTIKENGVNIGGHAGSAYVYFDSGYGGGYIGKVWADVLVTGASAGDLIMRSDNYNIDFTANAVATIQMRIMSSGNVGIGNKDPGDKLTISGGNLTVGGLTSSSTLSGGYLAIATSTTDMVGKFYVDSSGNVSASGTITGVNVVISPTGYMVIPNGTDPTVNSAGKIAINTTSASSSFRFYNGTAERALYPDSNSSIIITSSTLAQFGGLSATSSIPIGFASNHGETFIEATCAANVAIGFNFNDGTNNTDYIACGATTSTVTFTVNNTFTMREAKFISTLPSASFQQAILTWVFRKNAD